MRHKILVIGCGGIGSFLTEHVYQLVLRKQIDLENTEITICDDDTVELKNIKYQNYTKEDILKNKAEVLSDRYSFTPMKERMENALQLSPYNFIVMCVDNSQCRELVYKYCNKTHTYFLDLRSEGRAVAAFTKHKENTTEKLLSTLKNTDKSGSCQLEFEIEKGIIQYGNVIVAAIGAQFILNKLRGETNPAEYKHYF